MTMTGSCRECGCQDLTACWDEESGTPCFWVAPDLCSRCAGTPNAEEMELAERMALFYACIQACLEQNRQPVLIVTESNANPGDFAYMGTVAPAEVPGLLTHLLGTFDQTAIIHSGIDLSVSKRTIDTRREPGRN